MTGAQRSHKPAKPRQPTGWQDHAACRDQDPTLFFKSHLAQWGLQVCAGCVVQTPCAASRHGSEGIWGGKAHYPRVGRPRK